MAEARVKMPPEQTEGRGYCQLRRVQQRREGAEHTVNLRILG